MGGVLMEEVPDSKQATNRREKALKDYDVGVQRFHRSLGAIQHAADQAKTSTPADPVSDSRPRYASVKVLRDLPDTA
jgi:hypothetical protein